MVRTFVLLVGIILVAQVSMAQKDVVAMKGVLKQHGSSKKLTGVTVTLFENGSQKGKVITSSNGKFDFGLAYDNDYKVVFTKDGYVSKNIVIDTKNIPPEEKERGWFEIPMELSLFEEVDDLDVSILSQPIGKYSFDPSSNDIVHDAAYTDKMKSKVNSLMKEYEKKKKEEEKKRLEEEQEALAEAERLAEAEGEFNALMEEGDNAMSTDDYETAVNAYQKALDLISNDGIAKDKLADAKEKFEAWQAENAEKEKAEAELKAKEEAYKAAIDAGDDLFKSKDFEQAKAKYEAALTHKPDEQYPKDKIVACDESIAEAKEEADRLANLENEYTQTLQDAEDAVAEKDYETALVNFQLASEMKPKEKYPKEKMKEVQDLLLNAQAEAEALKKQEEEYRKIIATADEAFKSEDYEKAVNSYKKALDVKGDEQYPKDQIAKGEKILADALAEQEAAEKLEADYQAAIKEGDKAVSSEEWETALTAYQKATELKPDEQYPKDQIAAANTALADLQAEKDRLAQLDADYEAAIKEADGLFDGKDYQSAIASYEKAAALKGDEQYPKERIKSANEFIGKQGEYNEFVSQGDQALSAKDYSTAKTAFEKANKLLPDEAYPKDKIAEIEKTLAELKAEADAAAELKAKYEEAIKEGDKAFGSNDYEAAKIAYEKAQDLKSTEEYPKTKLGEIADILAAEQSEKERLEKLEKDYNDAIAKGDELFAADDYEGAIASFQSASTLKPEERYPKDKIKDAEGKLVTQEQYAEFIKNADAALAAKDYASAKTGYESASSVLPDEQYPKDQLAEIATTLGDLEAAEAAARKKEEDFLEAMKEGDKQVSQKEYQTALTNYKKAADIKPEEELPKTKIAEMEKLIADMSADAERLAALETEYNNYITEADGHMNSESYADAILAYKKAADVKPEITYPLDQIKKAEIALAEAERLAQEEADRLALEAASQAEKDSLAALEAERLAKEEAERLAADKAAQEEADRLAQEEADRLAKEEAERLALEAAEKEKADSLAALEAERLAQEEAERQALEAASQAEKDSLAAIEAERLAKLEAERLAAEKAAQEEVDRLAQIEADRLAKEEEERLALEAASQAEKDSLAAIEAERLAKEEAERQALEAASQAEKDSLAAIEAERLAKEEAERLARESADKEEADRLAALEADRLAEEEKNRLEREEADRLERERLAKEEADRLAREEADRLAREAEMARANDPDAKYYGERVQGQTESAAERFMREALERDEAAKYERIQKIKEREDEWNADLIEEDYENIAEADAEIQEIKDTHAELAEENNSSRHQNAEDLVKVKEDRLDWNTDLEDASQDDRIDYKSDLDDAAADRVDMFAEKDETRKENAIERAEYKETQLDWNSDLEGSAQDDRIEMKTNLTQQERERGELFVGKDEQRIKNAEFIVEYKEYRDGWDADLEADAGDTRLEAKEALVEAEVDRADMFADKDDPRKENAIERAEYKEAQLEWDTDLQTDAIDARIETKETFVEAEADRAEMFADKDDIRLENVDERAEYKASRLEWDTDLIDAANDERLEAKDNLNEAEAERAEMMEGKDDPRKENAVERAKYKKAQLEWDSDLQTDATDARIEAKATIVQQEEDRNELIDGYQESRLQYVEDVKEFKEVLENTEAENIQNEAANRQENYEEVDKQKANAAVVAEGNNSNRDDYIENVNTQKDNVSEQITTLDDNAADARIETKESLDAIEYNVPKSYDEYYLSKLAEDYPQGVTEESYTQPNKIIIRRIVVTGNKADDYHSVIAKWGTFYFKNGRSISEYIWNLETVKSD